MTPRRKNPLRDPWVVEMLAERRLARVQPNMPAAGAAINDARGTAAGARKAATDSPSLALAGFHSAVRKAISAHMAANGLKVDADLGGHRLVVEYARVVLGEDLSEEQLEAIDDLRKDRNDSEYAGVHPDVLSRARLKAASVLADDIIATVARVLAEQAK